MHRRRELHDFPTLIVGGETLDDALSKEPEPKTAAGKREGRVEYGVPGGARNVVLGPLVVRAA